MKRLQSLLVMIIVGNGHMLLWRSCIDNVSVQQFLAGASAWRDLRGGKEVAILVVLAFELAGWLHLIAM